MKQLFTLIAINLLVISIYGQKIASPTAGPSSEKGTLVTYKRNGSSATDTVSLEPILRPFYHGVASGDPLTDQVIIWTRVTPEGTTGSIEVDWQVATDTGMTNVVQTGQFRTDASRDYTVKVDVPGLSANTTYYYMFSYEGRNSLIGRTKTAPTGTLEDHLRFAVVSCSNYEAGYFNAYGRIADRNDLHAVVHLGDYFYEYPVDVYGDSLLSASGDRAHDTVETITLEQYRNRYSLYRLDPDLRRVHQQHPFLTIWDDHESANDAYKDGAENHTDSTEGSWNIRKNISKQVYFEWMPIREKVDSSIYRTLNYGDLADIIMIDTRLEGREVQILDVTNPALYAPTRTLLGNTQRDWFLDQLGNSTAKWKVVANQVMFAEFHVGWAAQMPQTPQEVESIFLDIWDGYPAERQAILDFIDTSGIDNVVVITGDVHSSFAYDVADTVTNPAAFYAPVPNYDPQTGAGSVCVEFVTPSVTSANFDENVGAAAAAGLEFQINNPLPMTTANIPNPHMKYNDLDRHGYFLLDLKNDSAQANWYYVDKLNEPSTVEAFGAGFYTKDGDNHLTRATGESPQKAVQDIPAPTNPPGNTVSIDAGVERSFALLNVYPNPVQGQLRLNYALAKKQQLRIRLLDIKGKEVQNLFEGIHEAGVHTLWKEVENVAPGMYLISMESENQQMIRKVVVQ
ncbi:MAG: alkaline phosphatase D family protein [Bacteroidota bacterium]